MNSNIKLIAFDLDGTVLNSKKNITPRTLEAIHKALSGGIHIIPATGRQLFDIPQQIKDCAPSFIIANNGAQIYSMPGENLDRSTCYEKNTVLALLRDFRSFRGMIFGAYDTVGAFDNKGRGFEEGITNRKRNSATWKINYQLTDIEALILEGKRFIKLVMIFEDPAERQRAFDRFLPRADLYVTYFAEDNIEIMPAGISKGKALEFVAEKLNIDMKNVMAIGDSDNDKEMIQKAGLGIAMGNAAEGIKAAADEVVPDCDRDGAALAIEKVLSPGQTPR
ncbi:MAG: Cof-type HAD-IIB family hydrolase [Treponema sp.]|jgi:Cof subfamily protein (haloacid dehalogenase superfamily)|nr:Cof-type HAD-IIB family hydrolase [Treponema sp.]